MSDQESYGRFTPGAWNLIRKAVQTLSEEEQETLRLMIETKTETITQDEANAMIYTVVRG